MAVVRQASALLLAALFMSRGLFAQDSVPPPPAPPAPPEVPGALPPAPADQAHVTLRPIELRYVQQETLLVPQTSAIKGLYVNAWAFGSPKLWHLVRLADETEINAFVLHVHDEGIDLGLVGRSHRPADRRERVHPRQGREGAARHAGGARDLRDRPHRRREGPIARGAQARLVGEGSHHGRAVARPDPQRVGGCVQRFGVDLFGAAGGGSRAAGVQRGAVRLRALPGRAARAHGDRDLPGTPWPNAARGGARAHHAAAQSPEAARRSGHVRYLWPHR